MTRPAADSVKVLWTGTGTGTLSLGSAVAGFQAFPASLNGAVVSYAIEHANGTERENGIGTYTSSGTTLTRDLVSFSTAGAPTKVTFTAGDKHVRLTPLAGDLIENRATTDPTIDDDIADGYIAGRSRWLNTTTDTLFFCLDHANGAAVWVPLSTGNITLFRGGGATINEVASGPVAFQFVAGGFFALDQANNKHRSIDVLGPANGALTANMAVILPDPDLYEEGEEHYVEKNDTSNFIARVCGLNSPVSPVADAGTNVFTLTAHALVDNDIVIFRRGTLPSPLVAGTPYFTVGATANTFQVSATLGGSAIDLTTVGSAYVMFRGTFGLRRKDQFIVVKVVGTTSKKWQAQIGGQQDPSTFGQDIMRAADAAAVRTLTDALHDDPTAVGTFIAGLTEISTLDQTNDFIVLYDATDGLAHKIRWTGRLEAALDGANYSVTPFTPFGRNRLQMFTAAQNHIIEFPTGLSTTPPVYGAFLAPPANTLTLRRVAASGVSINGVASDAFTWVVPATGLVFWWIIDTNTVWLWGDRAGSLVMTGDLDFADFILSRPELKDFSETLVTDSVSGAVTRDFSTANNHSLTLTGNVTSLTISNPPATGRVGVITFRIIQDATGGRAWAHPSIIRWPGGTAPTLPTGANDVSILSYLTFNGGTHWYGFEGGLDFL